MSVIRLYKIPGIPKITSIKMCGIIPKITSIKMYGNIPKITSIKKYGIFSVRIRELRPAL